MFVKNVFSHILLGVVMIESVNIVNHVIDLANFVPNEQKFLYFTPKNEWGEGYSRMLQCNNMITT
jgi:hypothetical protein